MQTKAFLERVQGLQPVAIRISQGGEEIFSHIFEDDSRRNLYSGSKSYTSAAVGIAIREGLIDLHEKVVDAFADDLPETVLDYLAQAEIRDLLTMCLGQEKAHLMGEARPFIQEDDWVKYALAQPFSDAPNTKFLYNNVGPYLAGVLVQRRAGCDLVHYLMPRLFQPLGIKLPTWEVDPLGYTFGAGGLFQNSGEYHRFGQLYLNGGRWNGRQLIPEEWVMASTSRQVENNTPWGYGYLFWGGDKGSFRADGKYGQLSIILRDKDAVITVTNETRGGGVEEIKRAIFEELYPQL